MGEACVRHAPWFVKGYLRVGAALARQKRHGEAARAFARGLEMIREQSVEQDAGVERVREELQQALAEEMRALGIDSLQELACGQSEIGEEGVSGAIVTVSAGETAGNSMIDVLSEDVLVELMGAWLGPTELGRVARTCRFFRQVLSLPVHGVGQRALSCACCLQVCVTSSSSSEKLWKAVCLRIWPDRSMLLSSPSRDWRTFSRERRACDRAWDQGLRGAPPISLLKMDQMPVFNVLLPPSSSTTACLHLLSNKPIIVANPENRQIHKCFDGFAVEY